MRINNFITICNCSKNDHLCLCLWSHRDSYRYVAMICCEPAQIERFNLAANFRFHWFLGSQHECIFTAPAVNCLLHWQTDWMKIAVQIAWRIGNRKTDAGDDDQYNLHNCSNNLNPLYTSSLSPLKIPAELSGPLVGIGWSIYLVHINFMELLLFTAILVQWGSISQCNC